jgi:hypothetical protein
MESGSLLAHPTLSRFRVMEGHGPSLVPVAITRRPNFEQEAQIDCMYRCGRAGRGRQTRAA